MKEKRPVRVIKRDQRVQSEPAAAESRATAPARAARDVVSGWVREHQRKVEEFRQNYAALLTEMGLGLPRRSHGS